MEWRDDAELFGLIQKELYTPVVGDVLDNLGFYNQFLPQPIQPTRESMVVVGRAMPVQIAAIHGPREQPFGKLTESLDQLRPGDVYLATGAFDCASWGELLTATARVRGATGAVIDGFHRDTPMILEQDWPVFSRGRYARDAGVRSSVVNYRCPVVVVGTRVLPGDLVFGDLDGVLIVPAAVEQETITKALEKARGEKLVRKEIEAGMSATDAFRKYGIL